MSLFKLSLILPLIKVNFFNASSISLDNVINNRSEEDDDDKEDDEVDDVDGALDKLDTFLFEVV